MFQREERFIVVKLKDLTSEEEDSLKDFIWEKGIPTSECVVIKSDWEPEYEMAWNLIEERYNRVQAEKDNR